MDLYLNTLEFTKTSALETTLPEDPNNWNQEILQELYKQVPYVADYAPTIVITNSDLDQGYAVGHFEIKSKSEAPQDLNDQQREVVNLRHVRIPIIIRDRKLQPLDVLIAENSRPMPLTEQRMRQALFRPEIFDVTSETPGDQTMISQLYPPYRQNYGFGGGGVAFGGEKTGSVPLAAERDFEGKLVALLGQTDRDIAKGGNSTIPESPVTLGDFAGEKKASRKLSSAILKRAANKYADGVGSGNTKPVADALLQLKIKDIVADQAKAVAKEGSSVLDKIIGSIHSRDYEKFASAMQDRVVAATYIQNKAATGRSLQKLEAARVIEPHARMEKLSSLAVKPQVCQIRRTGDGYSVKTASTVAWLPETRTINRKSALNLFGEKVVLAADVSGAVTMNEGPEVVGPTEQDIVGDSMKYGVINRFGLYKVKNQAGKELIGFVIPNLIELTGEKTSASLFTNGSEYCVQDTIIGEPAGAGMNLPQGEPIDYGSFYRLLDNGEVEAIVPMRIRGKVVEQDGMRYLGVTSDGHNANLLVQPGIKQPMMVEDSLLLPDDFIWTPIDESGYVQLQDDVWAMNKTSMVHRELLKVTVRGNGGLFSFDGPCLSKLAHQEKSFLNLDDATFLLAGLGVNSSFGAKKLAEANHYCKPVEVRVGRIIKTAEQLADQSTANTSKIRALIPDLRHDLFKEAGTLPDPDTVDTVLALGFINEENILQLISALPQLEESQSRLCELLVAARIGLSSVPVPALEKCIRALEQVIDGLKILTFTGGQTEPEPVPQQMSQ